ncbi:NrfD/PsrC family molybdoenzyme membrane anchor subunit [Slackia piriformis]|uniref:Polysulfide reductase NrfD n=1 Tax=Slackia piriformis YIT 12062 TaxID=742818 RepID=K0YX60_9ACTN|nr:NrfD/PsrC family molybdoenzyme membrane anchor subunit [Slackia piriformis]EJZ84099.1 hypothetical protein HMPREF9451_00808 [Slackia piriformis YIT 12062]
MTFSELIAVYLFLGGTAAGAYAVLASLDTCEAVRARYGNAGGGRRTEGRLCESSYRRMQRIVYGASLAMMAVGVLCLIADLGRPDAFYYLMIYPTGSLVSIGALALSLLIGCLVAGFCDAAFTLGERAGSALLAAKAAGVPVAFAVMTYTGMLLESAVAVKLWQTPWLPVLFMLSALSCGCVVVLLGMCLCEDRRAVTRWESRLVRFDFLVVLLETAVAALLFADLARVADASTLHEVLAGEHASMFWLGFVSCSLLLPLSAEAFSMAGRRRLRPSSLALVSACVLAGGLCLRIVMVAAGVQPVV